ncbi:MAG: methylated-DNA--[protein]-cysteine S-methyltransferase [Minicystis sp.]
MSLVTATHDSPLGLVVFAITDGALCAMDFEERAPALEARLARRFGRAPARDDAAARPVAERLERYFQGDLRALDDLAVDAAGTPFQKRVWDALRTIPAGETRAYADIAEAVGAPTAVRAVGAANGQNPIGLVVPCHRVIGKGGALTGYAGGLWRKKWLLEHERAHAAR